MPIYIYGQRYNNMKTFGIFACIKIGIMREERIETKLTVCTLHELTPRERTLCEAAFEAAENAYAPYSRFKVGAAVLLANGQVVTGSNQENAAYPSGLCAERVALFYATSRYPGISVEMLALTAVSEGKQVEHISPCGGCRQVMTEVENRYKQSIKLLFCGRDEIVRLDSAESLLPLSFGDADLLR